MALMTSGGGWLVGCASPARRLVPSSAGALSTLAHPGRCSTCRALRISAPPRRGFTLGVTSEKIEVAPATERPHGAKDAPGTSCGLTTVNVDVKDPRVAILTASKSAAVSVKENGRPVSEYMALPASQYSVLDAKRVERLDDDTFRCFIGGINLLGFTVEPVITVSVTVQDRGCIVRLLSCQLQGNRLVEAANTRFDASMVNQLSWRVDKKTLENKEIVSDLTLEVALIVPSWFRIVSPGAVSATGSKVMQQVVNQMVPRFLGQLELDYARWAAGDETRKPMGEGLGFEQH